jgi:hypothetical protein
MWPDRAPLFFQRNARSNYIGSGNAFPSSHDDLALHTNTTLVAMHVVTVQFRNRKEVRFLYAQAMLHPTKYQTCFSGRPYGSKLS